MSTPAPLIYTFLDKGTMRLSVIHEGQMWSWALSLDDITSITATIAEWQAHTMRRIAKQYALDVLPRLQSRDS